MRLKPITKKVKRNILKTTDNSMSAARGEVRRNLYFVLVGNELRCGKYIEEKPQRTQRNATEDTGEVACILCVLCETSVTSVVKLSKT
jgi:hypothetical protein